MSECDPIDACCVASLICLSLGIIFSSLGLVINTEYKLNPNIPAKRMEDTERYYERLVLFLRLCDIFGISMVTTGGSLLILVVVVMAIRGEFFGNSQDGDEKNGEREGFHDDGKRQQFPLLSRWASNRYHGYGSNAPTGK